MTEEEKEDKIIRKLEGLISLKKDDVNSFFTEIDKNNINIENCLFFLIQNKVVTDYWKTGELKLTPKGNWILANIDKRGFVFQKNKKRKRKIQSIIILIASIVAAVTGLVAIILELIHPKC